MYSEAYWVCCDTNYPLTVYKCTSCGRYTRGKGSYQTENTQLKGNLSDHVGMLADCEDDIGKLKDQLKVEREALESIAKDDYLWPSHRTGSEYTAAEFAQDALDGKARMWSNEQALKQIKES